MPVMKAPCAQLPGGGGLSSESNARATSRPESLLPEQREIPCYWNDRDPVGSSSADAVKSVCWGGVGMTPKEESASRGPILAAAHMKPEHRTWHTASA